MTARESESTLQWSHLIILSTPCITKLINLKTKFEPGVGRTLYSNAASIYSITKEFQHIYRPENTDKLKKHNKKGLKIQVIKQSQYLSLTTIG